MANRRRPGRYYADRTVPLAGYGGATRMSTRVEHPIWLKALAFREDQGAISVIVTADLVGLSDRMVARISADALKSHGIQRERLILNGSHNHSCPITEDVLWLYYELSPEQAAARDRYTERVYQAYEKVIGEAIRAIAPADLAYEIGLAGFAVNRRRARGPDSRAFGNQVDHDVPVLAVRSDQKVRAILFGYSCHTTAIGGLTINGDYAGYAQLELEETYPDASRCSCKIVAGMRILYRAFVATMRLLRLWRASTERFLRSRFGK